MCIYYSSLCPGGGRPHSNHFFSFTETKPDYSLILDSQLVQGVLPVHTQDGVVRSGVDWSIRAALFSVSDTWGLHLLVVLGGNVYLAAAAIFHCVNCETSRKYIIVLYIV